MLEMREVLTSTLLPDLERRDDLAENLPIAQIAKNWNEECRLRTLVDQYGWMNCLRSNEVQKNIDDPTEKRKCRWIHISSKFPEYLPGCLAGLSDWTKDPERIATALQQLDLCINQNERFSKHGRYFAPFVQDLLEGYDEVDDVKGLARPMLLSVPFLDWALDGEQPPLRFQVDPREGYQSSRSSSHPLRSILQYFYRLEDTADREAYQVFTKHKPWVTDRDLDLKVRRWYGHHPTALNVDELWILVMDERHVVTFSSNQSWKSRWPPLQVASRIMEVSFRGIRNTILNSSKTQDYTAYTHILTAMSGAVGMLHRSFWTDITLCLSDRYAGYLGHLEYRLHRSPNTRLVMDLMQVQEELKIIIQIMEQQMELVRSVQELLKSLGLVASSSPRCSTLPTGRLERRLTKRIETYPHPGISTFRQLSFSHRTDPSAQVLENLEREYTDLVALRENSDTLVNRTIQLVNIRLEDHGKAIIVFTIVTIVFLPLSFVSSFFGMNFKDIRDMERTQGLFWTISACLTTATVGSAIFLAFFGGSIAEMLRDMSDDWKRKWREKRKANRKVPSRLSEGEGSSSRGLVGRVRKKSLRGALEKGTARGGVPGFKVLDAAGGRTGRGGL